MKVLLSWGDYDKMDKMDKMVLMFGSVHEGSTYN